MKYVPLPAEQLQPTCQTTIAFLESDDVRVPGSMNDAIVSAKSLLKAILNGQLAVCQQLPDEPAAPATPPEVVEEPEEEAEEAA